MLQDLKSNYNQEADFDRTMGNDCETSQMSKMPRIEKPSMSQFKTEKQLLGCQSAVFNPRKIKFEHKRNASVNSFEKTKHKNKMVPMSTHDYYKRLKEMQTRLEKARKEIKGNVSRSRSRSRSRSDINSSQAQTVSACASHKIPDYLQRVLSQKGSSKKRPQDERPNHRESSRTIVESNQSQRGYRKQSGHRR